MKTVQNQIVKITTAGNLGTGFIFLPDNLPEYFYIFTARHVVAKSINAENGSMSIQISFSDTLNTVYNLSAEDIMLHGENDDKEDFAILVLKRSIIPASLDLRDTSTIAMLTGQEKNCFITGMPKAVQNKVQRSLYLGAILSDKDYPEQVQVEISDPLTTNYNADTLMEGYSGSPLFITSGEKKFAFAIFSQYDETMRRILAINFSKVTALLIRSGYPELQVQEVETDEAILADIERLRLNTSRIMNRVRGEVGSLKIPRTDLADEAKEKIINHSFLLVTGNAGVGKTALIKEVLMHLNPQYEVIALQGEQMDKPTITEIFQGGPFQFSRDFELLLDSKGLKESKILLIDSIEKILETSNAATIVDFFGIITKRTDLKIILTCRSYAVEQLKIRFLQQFIEFNSLNVPLLTDNELEEVKLSYPGLSGLMQKPSLTNLLKIPFNLDKAILVQREMPAAIINSEKDFRNIMWEYVIENKQKEIAPVKMRKRGEALEDIALRRATAMVPYIGAGALDVDIIQELVKDNIVEENMDKNQFAASHDIFEDWALTRMIEKSYQQYINSGNSIEFFFDSIGFAPAIRRAFRIWITGKLEEVEYNTQELIQKTLITTALPEFWRDEILIAILQSPYSAAFFTENRELMLSDNFRIFRRTILLLNVACQQPDLSNVKSVGAEDKIQLYSSYNLKPVGQAWGNLIAFIHANLDALEGHYAIIVKLLLQWQKSIEIELPPESRMGGLIIIEYLKFSPSPDENGYRPRKASVTDCIHLLFKLARLLKNELKIILETALAFDRKTTTERKDEISEKVIKEVLTWLYSGDICYIFPELVIKIAEKEWYYFKPSAEELEKMREHFPFKSMPRAMEKEEEFGVKDRSLHIFPASPLQLPIMHLLNSDTPKALGFIVKLFNHSVDAFWASDFLLEDSIILRADPRVEISMQLPDGTMASQKGTLALWLMFRGTYIATPYLLQSVLMALEKWLLLMAKIANNEQQSEKMPHCKERLMYTFDYLLKTSRSVSTTAVLVSVATAYPELLSQEIIPIFKVKQFYGWDLLRCHYDNSVLAPLGTSPIARHIQKERFESNKLPHRQEHLEMLFLKMSFGPLSTDLLEVLDNFYAEEPLETDWKFSLNRMDRRKLQTVEKQGNKLLVQTKIDEDLLPQAQAAQLQKEAIAPVNEGLLWAHNKLENKSVENDSIAQWRLHRHNMLTSRLSGSQAKLYVQPTVLAAVGIRDFFSQLTSDELTWCTDKILKVVNYEIERSFRQYDMGLDSPYGSFESGAAYNALMDLAINSRDDNQAHAKELIFASLVFIHDKLDRDLLIEKFKAQAWEKLPDFAIACVAGLIEYAKISDLRTRIQFSSHWLQEEEQRPSLNLLKSSIKFLSNVLKSIRKGHKSESRSTNLKERAKWITTYDEVLTRIINEVIRDKYSIEFEKFNLNDLPAHLLFEAVSLTLPGNNIPTVHEFLSLMIKYIRHNIDRSGNFNDEKIHYEALQKFEQYIAAFLLQQPLSIATQKFNELLTMIAITEHDSHYPRKQLDFLEKCLDELIVRAMAAEQLNENFWPLWKILSQEFQEGRAPFPEKLLLDYPYWTRELENWPPLNGKKDFYDVVIPHLTEFKPLIKLLAGIGFIAFMPKGLLWVSQALGKIDFQEKNVTGFTEKLAMKIFYDQKIRAAVRNNKELRDAFISILDKLIEESSAPAFLIREGFISLN